jgi:hypothetical protein
VRIEADGSQIPFYGQDMPTGYWSLMTVVETGQMRRIPNQLGADMAEFDAAPHPEQAVALFLE